MLKATTTNDFKLSKHISFEFLRFKIKFPINSLFTYMIIFMSRFLLRCVVTYHKFKLNIDINFFPVHVCLCFWVSIVVVQSVSVCRLLLVLLLFCSCRSFYVYKWTNFDVLLCASLSLSVFALLPLPLLCWKVIVLLLSFCRVCFWNM